MSHVATIDLEIKDLAALKAACAKLGLQFVENQRTYAWFGKRQQSQPYVLPTGFTEADLGKCDHAIVMPGRAPTSRYDTTGYQIGVCKRRDGRPGYTLLYDYWKGSSNQKCLVDFVGQNANKLKQSYAAEVAVKAAQQAGMRVTGQTVRKDGTIVLSVMR